MNRRKRRKRQLAYFLITLMIVTGVGAAALYLITKASGGAVKPVPSEKLQAESGEQALNAERGGSVELPETSELIKPEDKEKESEESNVSEPITKIKSVTMAFGGDA